MKQRLLFYSIAALAVIALIVGVISYATERHPTQTGFSTTPVEQSATSVTSTEGQTPATVKKKSCGCCAERIARLQEQIRKARERRQVPQQTAATEASQQQPSRTRDAP